MVEEKGKIMSEYSIAIRTLGEAGEKYQKTLNSIKQSRLQPKKIIVVLPNGYELPKERVGNEQFAYCEKSMIQQRIEALKHIDTEYTLFLDDDIEFDAFFVEKLLKPLEENLFECSTGPLFSFFPASKAGRIVGTLTASVSCSIFNRDKYVKILRSGGWSYHYFDTNKKHYYPTESFAWTCFMIRTDVMKSLHMEDEKNWIEKFGYAYGDDRVMAYKLIKKGYSACVVSNALYNHLDAKTSTGKTEKKSTKPVFGLAYMQTIFWKRFIQDLETCPGMKIINRIWFIYWKVTMTAYHACKLVLNPSEYLPYWKAFQEGMKEGHKFIVSREYKNLKEVI